MVDAVKAAAKDGDSLGGIVEVLGFDVPMGLGSHVHWDRRIDGRLAQALMSIQAMKAVEIGEGAAVAAERGSAAHDEILWSEDDGYTRGSDRAGGIEGGMTTGSLLVARASMKPLATLNRPVLRTVDVNTKEETVSFKERTDVTAVPAAGVVAETMVALGPRRRGDAEVRRRLDARAHAQPPRVRRLPVSGAHDRSGEPATDRAGAQPPTSGAHRVDGRGQDDGRTALREALGRGFVDTDDLVATQAGASVPEVFAAEGEAGIPGARAGGGRRRGRLAGAAGDRVRRRRDGRRREPARGARPPASSCGSRVRPPSSRRASSATARPVGRCWPARRRRSRSPGSPGSGRARTRKPRTRGSAPAAATSRRSPRRCSPRTEPPTHTGGTP